MSQKWAKSIEDKTKQNNNDKKIDRKTQLKGRNKKILHPSPCPDLE